MKTFNGHVERIETTGKTNCDGMGFDEIFATLAQLKEVTHKKLVYSGETNTIHEVK